MSFNEIVKSRCGRLSIDRITILRFEQVDLSAIPRGVLFVLATWSAAALVSLQLLCEALATESGGQCPLFVIDADDKDSSGFERVFGELPHGWGEAAWIMNGQIVHSDKGYRVDNAETLSARIRLISRDSGPPR